jgi:single-strand DNA-binding protein
VVASGVLKPRTYETKAGETRSGLELEVEEVGLYMRYTAATPAARPSTTERLPKGAEPDGTHPADSFTISPRQYADDEAWFGLRANPSGFVAPPVITETPVYKSE